MVDPLIFVRAVHFAATVLTSGTVAFMVLVAGPAAPVMKTAGFAALRRRLVMLIWIALAVAILSGAAWLVLLASDILGTSIADVCLHGGAWPVITDTRFGVVWSVRLVLALLLGLLVLWPATRNLQLAAAAALIALPALVGHAGATPGTPGDFHLVSDMVHLLAAGAWLGSLPALVLLLTQAYRAAQPAWNNFATIATHRFSILGMFSVGGLLATGIVNSWNLLGGPRDLVATDYGRLVALKIALFASMVAIATVNRFYLTPRLPKRTALRALRRNSVAEICLGLCVLLFVGMLGTLPPAAHVHTRPAGIPPDAAFTHIHDADAMADVIIDPGRAGRADATIRVLREDFSQFPAKEVRLMLDPPKAGARAVEQTATERADGIWLVNAIEISESGIWTVRVIVTTRRGKRIVLDAPIVIER